MRHAWLRSGILAVSLGTASWAPAQHRGVLTPEKDVRLAFSVGGVVGKVLVKPGDAVRAGQVLVEQDDPVGIAQIEMYRLRSGSGLAVEAAEMSLKLAQVEEGLVKDALAKGSAGQFEADRASLKAGLARLELEKARQDRVEAAIALKQAEAAHATRVMSAPIDGVVDEVVAQPGESAEAGRPIVRVVSAERVRVEVNPPTGETLSLRTGAPAWVRMTGANGRPVDREAVVAHVALVADARSDTRLVRLSMPGEADTPTGVAVIVYFARPEAPAAIETPKVEGSSR